MSLKRVRRSASLLLAGWMAGASLLSASDDTLEHAKELYAAAAYDEALVVLDRLNQAEPATDATSIAEYRVFCLLALDRGDEARRNIEAILQRNPLYLPSEDRTSPRIQGVFRAVRRQSLPRIVMDRYAAAKSAFERKDPQAKQQFDAVLALLDDPDVRETPALGDLRTVVAAFRDLTVAMSAASLSEPVRAPANAARAAAAGDDAERGAPSEAVYTGGDTDVIPPVARSQSMPRWTASPATPIRSFTGTLEVLIDADGQVVSAALRSSVHPAYDNKLLKAARGWTFAPATRRGIPVRYLKVIEIQLIRNPS